MNEDEIEGGEVDERHIVVVDAGRLDAVVAAALNESRSRTAHRIDDGAVRVDGVIASKASYKLRGGEHVSVVLSAPVASELIAEDLPLTLVYDDDDCCVIDKAAGMVVHPGAGHETGTVANALMHRFPHLHIGGERRPGIVHRLDKDTSGLLIVAKNDEALRALQAQFAGRTIIKRYTAVCRGAPGDVGDTVVIDTGHMRHGGDRRRFTTRVAVPTSEGGPIRRAHSDVTVVAVKDGAAVVNVLLHTGRTHQIRAHLADIGHPLVQDDLYGGGHSEKHLKPGAVKDAVARLRRHALHASSLRFTQPRTHDVIELTSTPPADLGAVIDAIAS